MSATSQPATFSDLYTLLLNAMRGDTTATGSVSQAKRAINMALYDMHLGTDYKVPWAERRAVLRTQQDYTTGTVAVTQGSTAVTGTGSLWATANPFGIANARANGKMVFSGARVPYVVQTVTNDTAIVLAEKFTEATSASSTYVYFEDEYDLATDFLRPIDAQQFSDVMEIPLISRQEFRRRFPVNSTPGRPVVACILDFAPVSNVTPIRRVKLAAPPNNFIQIPYTYITANLVFKADGTAQTGFSADSDEPIVPLRYRHAIFFHAAYHWFRDKKDDTRSQEMKAEYVDIMSRIMMDTEVGGNRPRLAPKIAPYVRSARRPWRGGGTAKRYDNGGWFDRMSDVKDR